MLYAFFKSLILPPVSLVLLIFLGLLWWRRPLLGRGLVLMSALTLLALSVPLVSATLMAGLQYHRPLSNEDLRDPRAQAIVVLSGDRIRATPELGGDDVGPLTLQRLRYAAWLQRRTGLPLIPSGGGPPEDFPPLAELMRLALETELRVPVTTVEDRSRTTWENARNTAELLAARHIDHIFLVTHAWHLPRAVAAFERAGLAVTPAPTAFVAAGDVEVEGRDLWPSARALVSSHLAFHEYLGQWWYRIREAFE